jgi:plastocyanin
MPRMSTPTRLLALLGVLFLAACGDDDREGSFTSQSGTGTQTTGTGTGATPTTTAPSGAPSKTFEISEVEFRLEPANINVPRPGVVEFVVSNDGGTVHALEVEGPTGEFETEEIQPGDQARLRADVSEAGNYKLYCPVGNHEAQGMVGRLVVGGSFQRPPDDSGSQDDTGDDDSGGTPAPGY